MKASNKKKIEIALTSIIEAKAMLEEVSEIEQDIYDERSERWQESERGEEVAEALALLEDAICELEEVGDMIDEVKDNL